MSGFFDEVKRRKVYRVAVAYVIAAGGIIQIASAVFPAWELPNWALRLVIVLLLIGFPIALILAWAFDVTPHGIRATSAAEVSSAPLRSRRNMIMLCTAGVLVSAAAGFFLLPKASARRVDKSIAVLPFENFSDDKDNAYFADGIQDDILTILAKIGDLKVISRTSVMPYRGKTGNVREIGKALGVSAVLEGSVRKDKNRVRINVQLINTTNDEHMWSEIYDRDLTDVFAIQTDLAQKIANELQAKLSPSEKAQLTRKPTENGEAYLAFIEAHNLDTDRDDYAKLLKAEQLYDRALQLDPSFALAGAAQSLLQSWIFHNFDPTTQRRTRGRELAQKALTLQPNLPEGHLALGFSYYYADRDYDRALQEFEVARQGLPNSADVYLAIGAIQRRQGKWKESTTNLEKASTLDPNSTWPLQNLAMNYQMTRDFASTNRTIDRALRINPSSLTLWSMKSACAIAERGDTTIAEKGIEMMNAAPPEVSQSSHAALTRAEVFEGQRKYPEMLRELAAISDTTFAKEPAKLAAKYMGIGIAHRKLGDEASGRAAFIQVKGIAGQAVRETPDLAGPRTELAQALAYLGEKDAAIAEAKRATELQPESVDAFEGVRPTQELAQVYATVGEPDKAIDLIEHLLGRPSNLTPSVLKLDPIWDPIREHPRFKKIVEKS